MMIAARTRAFLPLDLSFQDAVWVLSCILARNASAAGNDESSPARAFPAPGPDSSGCFLGAELRKCCSYFIDTADGDHII